jgi:hypothetical protein
VSVVYVRVCGRSRPLSSGIGGTARLCSTTKLVGEYWTYRFIYTSCVWLIDIKREAISHSILEKNSMVICLCVHRNFRDRH